MIPEYLLLKYLHILIAIIALGTSAGLGIVLEFYGDHAAHGAYVLGMIKRLVAFFVLPGYLLVLATGLWMVHLSWPLTTRWILAALALWGGGVVILGLFLAALHRQSRLLDTEGRASASYRRAAVLGRALGGAFGLVVVVILYFMVFKPGAVA